MTRGAGVAWCKGHGHTETTEKEDQGQCHKGNLEKTCSGEMASKTVKHHWSKKPKLKTAAISEEGEDNWQWHQRMEQETESTSGKQGNTWQDLQKTTELEVANQIAGLPLDCRKRVTEHCGQPPPK
jgi:hypothetical protein